MTWEYMAKVAPEGWVIWRDKDGTWSSDSDEIQVTEFLDAAGRYCVDVTEPVPLDEFDEIDLGKFRYQARVLDVEDGAFLVDPFNEVEAA